MEMLNKRLTRRDLIKLGAMGLAGTGLAMVGCAQPQQQPLSPEAASKGASAPSAAATTVQANIKRGGTFRSLQQQDFGTMWPALSSGQSPWACFDTLLVWRKDEKGRWGPKPWLAESWQLEGKKAVFKIRQGVKFHDGSDLDAEVVRWNIEMMRNHQRSTVKGLISAIDPNNPAQVLDKYTVQVNLTAPSPSILAEFSDGYSNLQGTEIVSKAAYEKMGEAGLEKQAVGTGPFKFVSFESGNQLVVKRNEDYWVTGQDGKPLPYLDGIVYRFIPDDSVRALEMRSGNAEFTERIGAKDMPPVKADPNLIFLPSQQSTGYFANMNPYKPPFADNLKLRQAVQYSIDREALANALGAGTGHPLKYDVFNPGSMGYDESVPYYWYDPDKAKQLLKEAGYPNGLDTSLMVISREIDLQQAEMLKQMMGNVGIRVTIESLERLAWLAKYQKAHDYQMATQAMSHLLADPDGRLSILWANDGPGGYIKIPEVGQCLAEAASSYDFDVRNKAYVDCQKVMYNSAWYLYMWALPFNYVVNKRVQNFPNDLFKYFRRELEVSLA